MLSIVVEVVVLVTVMLSMLPAFGLTVMLSIVVALPDFFSPPHDAMMRVDTNAANRIKFFIV